MDVVILVFINFHLFSDKQQEVDINNLRLSEEDPSVRAKTRTKGAACTASVPPLSQISGVKKPLTHMHSVTGGSSLPEHGVQSKNPQQLAKVLYILYLKPAYCQPVFNNDVKKGSSSVS